MKVTEFGGIDDPAESVEGKAGPVDPGMGGRRDQIGSEEAIAVAEGLFWSYVQDLKKHEAALEACQRGAIDPGELKQAMQTAKTIREAVHLLMAERNKVDKLRKDIAGGVGGGCLDLGAARDEIGRRLACLRRARGG